MARLCLTSRFGSAVVLGDACGCLTLSICCNSDLLSQPGHIVPWRRGCRRCKRRLQDKPATALYQSLGYEVIKQDCVLWGLLGQDRRHATALARN